MRSFVFVLVLALVCACARTEPVPDGGASALRRNLLRAGRVEVLVSDKDAIEPLQRAAARLARAGGIEGLDVFVRTPGQRDEPRSARIVVGTRASRLAESLAAITGVQVGGDATHAWFRYGRQPFEDANDAFIATFADPDRQGLPLTLVFANSARVAAILASDLAPGWKPWIRIFRAGDVVLDGPIDPSGTPLYARLDRVGLRRQAAQRNQSPLAHPPPGIVGRAAKDLAITRIDAYLARCLAARVHVANWASPDRVVPEVSVTLWSHFDDYELSGADDDLARFDPVDGRVDALVQGDLDDGAASVGRATAYASLGEPAEPWMLDAAGLDAAWTWWGIALDRWLARLNVARRVLTQDEMQDARAEERVSAHVLRPMRAAWWRFLRESRGERFLREIWQSTRALDTAGDIDTRFAEWLAARGASLTPDIEAERARDRAAASSLAFLRGVALSEPPESMEATRRGFGSRVSESSVDSARALGADAVALTTFAVDEPGLQGFAGSLGTRRLAPRGGDLGLILALRSARARGMRTLIQPHLLSAAGGTWSGSWTRKDRAEWAAFFERYARFVEHFALIAAITRADVLSLGGGIAQVSSAMSEGRRPIAGETDWKRAGWSRVIGSARAAFSGVVTYAAASTVEASKIAFWPELDAIALELAPTLEYDDTHDGGEARGEIAGEIQRALAELDRIATHTGKPILLTQVGFSPDLHGAAAALGSGSASAAWQARQFELFAEQLKSSPARARIAGVFAWRWSTDLDDGGLNAHDVVIADPAVRAAVHALLESL